MASPTVIIAFCPSKTESTSKPSLPVQYSALLQALRPEHLEAKEEDPNAGVFADSGGNASINFQRLTADERDKFISGKKYKITIEEIE